METAVSLYREGRLQAAVDELSKQLRRQPENTKMRSFLFELLCFAGEFKRAESQLDVLAAETGPPLLGRQPFEDYFKHNTGGRKYLNQRTFPSPLKTLREMFW